ncbi:MAG: alkaline phosphatase family protein [Clostridia bacterium]|nr:alkaline phosphatase family protein [Clostridia bacterium]
MEEIKYPDYNNSILNLITSILKFYKVETNHTSLEKLDEVLQKNYKNVVFMVLDGMGEHILKKISEDGFFRKNELDCITSVYPSTTTAALTTYYSGKPPYESGWIAWSQYFKEYGRAIDMLSHKESYQNDSLKNARINVFKEVVNYEPIFSRIEKASPDVKAYEITPEYSDVRSENSIRANNVKQICEDIKMICSSKTEGRKFIMAYCDNPDGLLHKYGCSSQEVKDMVMDAQNRIENMCKELEDTVVIISADHGHKDINKVYSILDYPEIQDCLIMPASLESRSLTFWVKEDRRNEFVRLFNTAFAGEFLLLTKEEFLEKHFLGYGEKHKKIDDFIGNYVALSISDAIIRLETHLAEGKKVKKSTHCGLTKDEMEVPLIVIE